ncbi:hypothetical protein [Porphyromonas levii]|uniref:hypothetical protein n=2 Tax=Porphyromonas levii TaxID=28114 RepID=UPI001DCF3065|nr:hypothetical protein [Porphyromonas levii]MBR8712292.1 hypothetical protein [Porphyromonas levii]MBR8714241.1 hypothetical protein [Porphyromonas levii]MBR8726783.1 hypothetical protein [Porphyromonas levii]MBR8735088.1 hypothetical protein [Porphyromonas levii]MBR8777191.1 hypothetical protein [Porphyromonas levii]
MTTIFQTLENRGNAEEILEHGPFFCALIDEKGKKKTGIKEPWMGEGYYFWDTRIEDAHWWGRTIYDNSDYIICATEYDQHSELLFDTVGIVQHLEDFSQCAQLLKEKIKEPIITIPAVIDFLKKNAEFPYQAIRMCPYPTNAKKNSFSTIKFPGNKTRFLFLDKVQICFFDKTLLTKPLSLAYPKPTHND